MTASKVNSRALRAVQKATWKRGMFKKRMTPGRDGYPDGVLLADGSEQFAHASRETIKETIFYEKYTGDILAHGPQWYVWKSVIGRAVRNQKCSIVDCRCDEYRNNWGMVAACMARCEQEMENYVYLVPTCSPRNTWRKADEYLTIDRVINGDIQDSFTLYEGTLIIPIKMFQKEGGNDIIQVNQDHYFTKEDLDIGNVVVPGSGGGDDYDDYEGGDDYDDYEDDW